MALSQVAAIVSRLSIYYVSASFSKYQTVGKILDPVKQSPKEVLVAHNFWKFFRIADMISDPKVGLFFG